MNMVPATSFWLLILTVFLCYGPVFFVTSTRGARMRSVVVNRFHAIQGCPHADVQETGFRLINYTLHRNKDGLEAVNVDVEFLRTIREWTSMTVILNRCRDVVSSNTCEYYQTWTWPSSMCAISQWKGVMWTPLVESITPTLKCPFKGYYRGRNMTLDYENIVKLLKTDGMVYQVEVRIYDEYRKLNVCFQFTAEARMIKVPV